MSILYYCKFCNREFTSEHGKSTHEWRCSENPKGDASNNWRKSVEQFKGQKLEPICKCSCDFCHKEFNYKSSKTLHQRYCKDNPNKEVFIYKSNFTEESKDKIRAAQKASWASGNRKPTTHNVRSYAEKYFDDIFVDAHKEYFQIGYFLDYAWPEKMCYIEVDGEQHYYFEDRVQRDKVRTLELSNIGWTCIARIRWSEFQKLSKLQKESYIQELKNGISNHIVIGDLKPTVSKKEKRQERSILFQKEREDKRDERREFILTQKDIDFTKFGWGTELAKRCNMSSQALLRWIKKYMPDFYKTCR